MVSDALIGAAFGGIVLVIGKVGDVIVNVIKAKKAPDQNDLNLKKEFEEEKALAAQSRQEFTEALEKISNNMDEGFAEMRKNFEKNKQTSLVELRHSITEIYYKYCEEKSFSHNVKEDVCSLYAQYKDLGGNSYVHEIYNEMMEWEVK